MDTWACVVDPAKLICGFKSDFDYTDQFDIFSFLFFLFFIV